MKTKEKTKSTETVNAITLKYSHLLALIGSKNGWLNLPLHSQQARSRNRIVLIFSERLTEYEQGRKELLDKYAEKDSKKELVIDEITNTYKIKNLEAFSKSHAELANQQVTFDILPSNKQDFKVVKEIILSGMKKEFDITETVLYEEICIAFEKIK